MSAVVRVSRSTVIDAPVDVVWRLLRDFNSHESWHPAIAESRIDAGEPGDSVGSVRSFRLADGSALREQLIALSDRDRELTYCLLEAPIPLVEYVATMRLRPITDGGRVLLTWESRFRPPVDRAEALSRIVAEEIYEAGFAALQARFGRPDARQPPIPPPPSTHPSQTPVDAVRPSEVTPSVGAVQEEGTAIIVERFGGPDVMSVATVGAPEPGPGEVRLRQSAIGVNFIDIYCRTGYLQLLTPPGVPGMEAAAVVRDVGSGVSHLSPGDRVVYACEPVGAYAEMRTMDAALLIPLPDNIGDEVAAAVFLKGLAVEFLIHAVHPVKAGDTILVHAAAGGTGLLLCQWANALGARVIGTVSNRKKAERALGAGADRAIVTTEEDFVEEVSRLTGGGGVDIAYDGVGAATFGRSLETLAIRGHLVSFGQASGPVGAWDIGAMASKSVTISRPSFGHYTTDPVELRAMAGRLFDAVRREVVRPTIDSRFPLTEAAAAHARLESRESIGAIILVPPSR
ncbi:MAG: zinc-binding dehydrogenase [Hyphomicrobiales bacterium]|nr:zinc-binding dehydrogenase [Hyphomicrobiales bacterium]